MKTKLNGWPQNFRKSDIDSLFDNPKISMPQLNTCPYYSHYVCGFCFHITFNGKEGVDQHGAEWINVAENDKSIIPEPKNPKYLDAYLDAYNNLRQYFK